MILGIQITFSKESTVKSFTLIAALVLLASCSTHKHDHSHHHSHDHKMKHTPKFSKLGKGEKVPFSPGHDMIVHVKTEDLPDHISVIEVLLAPKSLGAPPHIHKDEDEIFIVLDGTVHFLNGKEEVIAKKGTVAAMPRGHFHGFWNPTKKPAKMALIVAPGHFEKFFYAVKQAVKERKPSNPQEFGAIVAELAA